MSFWLWDVPDFLGRPGKGHERNSYREEMDDEKILLNILWPDPEIYSYSNAFFSPLARECYYIFIVWYACASSYLMHIYDSFMFSDMFDLSVGSFNLWYVYVPHFCKALFYKNACYYYFFPNIWPFFYRLGVDNTLFSLDDFFILKG